LPEALVPAGRWNGALVLDANHDERSDLFLVHPQDRPVLLLNQRAAKNPEAGPAFQVGAANSPPLLQAVAYDLDYDGWTDIIGLSDQHRPVLLQNQKGRLVQVADGLGKDT